MDAASYSSPRCHRVGGEREDQDRRVGRVDLLIGRIAAQAGRQIGARGVDRGLDVARRAVDVPVQAELQRNAGGAHRARRRHLGDVGDLSEMAFERACHRGGDVLRAGAGKNSLDRNGREIHLRQRGDRQFEKRHRPGRREPKRQQGRRDRPANEGCRRLHRSVRPGCLTDAVRPSGKANGETVEPEIDHRRREQRQHLTDNQTADNRDSERMAQFRADTGAERQRQTPSTAAIVVIVIGRKRSMQA